METSVRNPSAQAYTTFEEVQQSGPAVRPLDFPPPHVRAGVRVNALVVHPGNGSRQVCSGVIHREDLSYDDDDDIIYDDDDNNTQKDKSRSSSSAATTTKTTSATAATTTATAAASKPKSSGFGSFLKGTRKSPPPTTTATTKTTTATSHNTANTTAGKNPNKVGRRREINAYWPQRRLQDAIYGSVWACLVLRRHYGVAADDAARAAGVEPGSVSAPIVWEITGDHVAIKMVEWSRVHHMRGRLLEDPVKEVAAMQMLMGHPNVLGSMEVLQDGDFLFSIMPFCRDGDLFGIVVQYAEESGGEIGMPEPVARYWFRQILWGLDHLQTQGVCHRDLSLENILVNGDRCMIIDMGMCLRVPYNSPEGNARIIADVQAGTIRRLMKPQGVCGKHNYMSPEVAANTESFDGFAIDLWAAGVILYIMLTGFPPYDQANRTDQRFELIIQGRLMEQLRKWDIKLSDDAGSLLQHMLQYDPRQRLTLAQVLEHPWVVSNEVEAPQPSNNLIF